MNRKIWLIIVSILLIVLLLLSALVGTKEKEDQTLSNDPEVVYANAQKESASVDSKEQKEFIGIDINQYLEMYNGTDKKIVLIARPTCHYCEIAEPILKNIAYLNNLDINYLNTDELTEEDSNTLTTSNEYFESGLGTPTLLIVGNSTIIDHVDGLTDKAHYIDFFKKNEFIK